MEEAKCLKLISPRKDLKKCNGNGCNGALRPLEDFYTKGKQKDGTPRYESICKKCKSTKTKAKRLKLKKSKKTKPKNKVIDIYECEVEILISNDHVKQDLERYLLDFAMDLIFELEEKNEEENNE